MTYNERRKTISVEVERLDEGFVVTENGKKKAIKGSSDLVDYLNIQFQDITNRATHNLCKTSSITISIIENPRQHEEVSQGF